jgi:hypothetical protein
VTRRGGRRAADLVSSMQAGRAYWVKFRCRPNYPGDEPVTGEGDFIYRGEVDQWGKHEFVPAGSGQTIYLFTDEVTDAYQLQARCRGRRRRGGPPAAIDPAKVRRALEGFELADSWAYTAGPAGALVITSQVQMARRWDDPEYRAWFALFMSRELGFLVHVAKVQSTRQTASVILARGRGQRR